MTNEKKTGAVAKAKRSLFRSQIRAIVILVVAALLLGVACGVVMYIVRQDIDVYTEVLAYNSDGKDTYVSYYSRRDGDGFAVYNDDGEKLSPFDYEQKVCYETENGTILTLNENGMFSVIAVLDNGDGETINSSNTALLLYKRTERAEIKSIEAVNNKGGWRIYSVLEDADGDGKKETNFYISGFESSPLSPTLLAAIVTRCGTLSLQVKLDRAKMEAEDEKHKNDLGYVPIITPDGSINYDIYGLADTYVETDEETGKKTEKPTPHFILTDKSGNVHKVIIGDLTSDGAYYYVRYENIASEILESPTATEEQKAKEREKLEKLEKNVYMLARDPSASSGYSSDMAVTVLASAAEICSPTVIYTYTTNNYYDVRKFTVQRREGDTFKKIISFTYDDLEARLNTIRQDLVYHIEDAEELGLVGYEMDTDRAFEALFGLTDISAAGSADVSGGAVTSANYVKTVALITSKVNDLSKITEDLIAKDPEIRDALLLLREYGVLEAKYILSYDTPFDISDPDSEVFSQAIMISERTERDTYYVWSPMFCQIVEVGAQYLSFLGWDSFDWVDRDLFHTMMTFADGLRVTSGDFDVLFDIFQKVTVATKHSFSASSGNYYTADIITDEFGNRRIDVAVNLLYLAQFADGSTSTKVHTVDMISLGLDVVKNYCKVLLGEDISGLTGDQLAAIERYAATLPDEDKKAANGIVTLTHRVTAVGDSYGYVPATGFIFTFTYTGGNLSLTAKQSGKNTTRTLYDDKLFDDYYTYYIDDKNSTREFTEEEISAIKSYFLCVDRVKTEETRVTATVNGGTPVDIDVDRFKDLYAELINVSFYGRVDETDSAGGIVLTEEQMKELAAGDTHSLKIEFYRSIGEDLVYRSYDYSATKSYTTINRSGRFYINKITKDAFVKLAKTIAAGDPVS